MGRDPFNSSVKLLPPRNDYLLPPRNDYLLPPRNGYLLPHRNDYLLPPRNDYLLPHRNDYLLPPRNGYLSPPRNDYLLPPRNDYLLPPRNDYLLPPRNDYLLPSRNDYIKLHCFAEQLWLYLTSSEAPVSRISARRGLRSMLGSSIRPDAYKIVIAIIVCPYHVVTKFDVESQSEKKIGILLNRYLM